MFAVPTGNTRKRTQLIISRLTRTHTALGSYSYVDKDTDAHTQNISLTLNRLFKSTFKDYSRT